MTQEAWTKKEARTWTIVFVLWALFPLLAVWLMLTHPGKCAKVWKMEVTGTWFN